MLWIIKNHTPTSSDGATKPDATIQQDSKYIQKTVLDMNGSLKYNDIRDMHACMFTNLDLKIFNSIFTNTLTTLMSEFCKRPTTETGTTDNVYLL